MKASETKLIKLLEGTQQYVVPLFQRPYKWEKKHWEDLWNDLMELYEEEKEGYLDWSHFIGSMVTMPTVSVPEGIAKYTLIDGQQRLTTLFIILSLIRDLAKNKHEHKILSEKINEMYLTNKFSTDNDYYKLMPSQVDRQIYKDIIDGNQPSNRNHKLFQAYKYFEKEINLSSVNLELLEKVITQRLIVVSIVLDKDDNPYLVFESLNAKGEPLEQSDLIRNHFFMKIPVSQQEQIYQNLWLPMQTSLDKNLTTFIRHFLMKDGAPVKEDAVYLQLKNKTGRLDVGGVINYLEKLVHFAGYYLKLLSPSHETEPSLAKALLRLNRMDVKTAYPFLLNCYDDYHHGKINLNEFVEIIRVLENFIVRRYICSVPTNQLNKIFPTLYPQAIKHESILAGVKDTLQSKNYPFDETFYRQLQNIALYGSGDRLSRTKFILETLEEAYGHKEVVDFEPLSIEHVMPQTLSDWWGDSLGPDADVIHELCIHTLGNLTLTAYNSELYNNPYPDKQKRLMDSHLELNKYFANEEKWDRQAIEKRSMLLADKALEVWPYFGVILSTQVTTTNITGSKPVNLIILGQQFNVETWRDVMEQTLNIIYDLDPDALDIIAAAYPRLIDIKKERLRSSRQLSNGMYIEVNLSAQDIKQFCIQAIELARLSNEDWQVEVVNGS